MHEQPGTEQPISAEHPISAGRILYLTKDPGLIIRQLAGEQLSDVPPSELMDNISTDAIAPNRACLAWDGKEEGYLGQHLLTGLTGVIKPGEIAGKFDAVVAGQSFARGSSRIHAPLAFQDAGIKLIIAKGERIFSENCANLRIHIVDPASEQAKKLLAGEIVEDEELLSLLPNQQAEVMRSGSLLKYFKAIEEERITIPQIETPLRPMTIAEKIIANKALDANGRIGVTAVKPGDEIIAVPDIYYGYELQTNATISALRQEFGETAQVRHPEKTFLYNDHTALLKDANTAMLRQGQAEFAQSLGITNYEIDPQSGAPAICHTDMVENHALPGQLILGNDSHTCSVGCLNTLAVGKGALDLAGAMAYNKMVVSVPETIRVNLKGKLPQGVTMKDFMLQFLATDELRQGVASARVLEFGGRALGEISLDQQYKLTNMAIEGNAYTGIIEPNSQIVKFLMEERGLTEDEVKRQMVYPDADATYSNTFDIDLSTVELTVSRPGDTQNGTPLSEITPQRIPIQKIYIGSCTHGTPEDLRQAAEVLRGRKVAKGIKLYVQASSRANLASSESKGYVKDLVDAGAELLPIGCGACMNAGPGSTEVGETGLFATNRNFPGRTGKGETYLCSPAVAAASAVEGYICGPDRLPPLPEYKHFEGVDIQWNKVPWRFEDADLGTVSIDTYSIWNPQHHAEIAQRLAEGQRCALYMMGNFGVGEFFNALGSEENFETLDSIKKRDRTQNLVVFANPDDTGDFMDFERLPEELRKLQNPQDRSAIYPEGPMHAILPVLDTKMPNPGLVKQADKSTSFFWIPGHWGYEQLAMELKKRASGLFGGGSLNIHGQEPSYTAAELKDKEMARHPEWLKNIDFVILDEIAESSEIGRSHTQVSFLGNMPQVIRRGSVSQRKIERDTGYELVGNEDVKQAASITPYNNTTNEVSDRKVEIVLARIARYQKAVAQGKFAS